MLHAISLQMFFLFFFFGFPWVLQLTRRALVLVAWVPYHQFLNCEPVKAQILQIRAKLIILIAIGIGESFQCYIDYKYHVSFQSIYSSPQLF